MGFSCTFPVDAPHLVRAVLLRFQVAEVSTREWTLELAKWGRRVHVCVYLSTSQCSRSHWLVIDVNPPLGPWVEPSRLWRPSRLLSAPPCWRLRDCVVKPAEVSSSFFLLSCPGLALESGGCWLWRISREALAPLLPPWRVSVGLAVLLPESP